MAWFPAPGPRNSEVDEDVRSDPPPRTIRQKGEECETSVEHGLPPWAEPAVGHCSRRPRPSPMWGSRFLGARAVGPWVGEQKALRKTLQRGNPSSEPTYQPTCSTASPPPVTHTSTPPSCLLFHSPFHVPTGTSSYCIDCTCTPSTPSHPASNFLSRALPSATSLLYLMGRSCPWYRHPAPLSWICICCTSCHTCSSDCPPCLPPDPWPSASTSTSRPTSSTSANRLSSPSCASPTLPSSGGHSSS